MNNAPQSRRSFWRFSLRELLLLMLAIAAFLGWWRAIYQRYKPFVPTPFARKLDVQSDIVLIRQQLGEPPASWANSSGSGTGGAGRYERDFRYGFPLRSDNGAPFVEMLRQRMRDQLNVGGCRILGTRVGSSGDLQEFRLRYLQSAVEGSIRVILIPSGDEARLLVFVEERRAP